ncbi:protein mono-ADP-ribosyltransferase PARP10 isoform X1 [Rousettus aegyptiacus]|nr:protein mono-ADP-ribosyltransferase PARP10 isoform X1 [Rousettus aegyptiacus]
MAEAEAEEGAAVELGGLSPSVSDELLMLYFENRRRSGGGPVLSWQRLGHGGVLTFQEPADAARVLAQEHTLQGARLSLWPAPPRAPARLLLQGLPPGTTPQRLEQHVQALLRATGHPEQPCRALASPRPDRALVQLPKPLSEAEVRELEEQARTLGLEGAEVSLARVPQTRAVRVVGGPSAADLLLLELYLENGRRSGGGPLDGLRSLPGAAGTVVCFRQWQVAEQVLQREHWLQGSQLSLVPHYDVLEPQGLAEDTSGRDHLAELGPGDTEHVPLETGGPGRAQKGAGTVILGSEEAPGQLGTFFRTSPIGSVGQAGPVISGPVGSPGREGPESLGPMGSPGREAPESLGPVGSPEREAPESLGPVGSPEREAPESLGPVGSPGREAPVETVLSMEPGALRFIQLYHEDLLAGLADVALFPLEGSDVTGFRLCGALGPCQAAEEFLQSLLGSISCHMLSLKLPGSASFLLGPEGQRLLRGLEAQFRCVFGTERLARDALNTDPGEADPTEALQALPGQSHALWPPESTGGDQEKLSLEEVRELLTSLEGLDGEDQLPEGLGEEEPEEQPEEEPDPMAEEGPPAPGAGVPAWLEEAELQLALHRSLEPQGREAEREEAAALRRALALSLLEPVQAQAEEGLLAGGPAQLLVHVAFEQDLEELDQALGAALEGHLREETVGLRGHTLPAELRARLERRHGVSVALHGDGAVLRGFGAQPARAARHLAALLAGPRDQGLAFVSEASRPTRKSAPGTGSPWGEPALRDQCPMHGPDPAPRVPVPQQQLEGPAGRLECLAESDREFQTVVQAFYDTLDAVHSRIHVVRVERVLHPLLQQQYELHRERLEQRCDRRPAEHVLYHGTSAQAVADICTYGFNRSFCGRNGTLYGQGVYFAKRASLSVQDRYSPPNADGHKAVFVARVLTGDYGQGRRGLRAPPLRAPGHVLLRYDSAVDCLRQPSIFVIFHDTQALPTHLITCQHMPRAPPSSRNPSGLLGYSPAT